MKQFYVVFIWEDVEPQLFGPYNLAIERDKKARELRKKEGDDHGIYWMNVENNKPIIGAYLGGFFIEADKKAYDKAMEIPVIDSQEVR